LVSHSMEDIARFADRVMVINEGKLFAYGTVDEVFSRTAELAQMGLAIPQISQIFLELSRRGYPVSPHVYTVEAAKQELLRALGRGAGAHA
ncbi:MAG: energy-coupling factor transporter ATPase, partial [Oscillospiraceae bacterium]